MPRPSLQTMHEAHGTTAGKACSECQFLVVASVRPHPRGAGVVNRWTCRKAPAVNVRRHRPEFRRQGQACGLFKAVD